MRRFCALADTLDATDSRWPRKTLSWFVQATLPGVLLDTMRAVARQALAGWAAVADLHFVEAASAQAADILLATGSIDGAQGTLAWSELPPSTPCHQRYDTGEHWSTDGTPGSAEIELLAVMAHELGHALGLQHAAQGTPDLMAPYYSPQIRTPQKGDVARIQALYGPPVVVAPPTAPPKPGGSVVTIIVTNADKIEIPGYRVTPL